MSDATAKPARTYVVLRSSTQDGEPDLEVGGGQKTWEEVGETEAHSDTQAIRKLAGDDPEGETFVAVPKRSWTPRTPTVEERPPLFRWS